MDNEMVKKALSMLKGDGLKTNNLTVTEGKGYTQALIPIPGIEGAAFSDGSKRNVWYQGKLYPAKDFFNQFGGGGKNDFQTPLSGQSRTPPQPITPQDQALKNQALTTGIKTNTPLAPQLPINQMQQNMAQNMMPIGNVNYAKQTQQVQPLGISNFQTQKPTYSSKTVNQPTSINQVRNSWQ